MKERFKKNKNTVHYIAETSIGEHYNTNKYIRNSMFLSWLGTSLVTTLGNYDDNKITYATKGGILTIFGISLINSIKDRRKRNEYIDKFDAIYTLIKKDIEEDEIEIIVNDTKEEQNATISFQDNSFIKEGIYNNNYICTYTDKSGEEKNITNEVVKILTKNVNKEGIL